MTKGTSDIWHFDEVLVWIGGVQHCLWRAVGQHGIVLDIPAQEKRDGAAAKRFFRRLLKGLQHKPKCLITDGLRSHGVTQCAMLHGVKHQTSRCLGIAPEAVRGLKALQQPIKAYALPARNSLSSRMFAWVMPAASNASS